MSATGARLRFHSDYRVEIEPIEIPELSRNQVLIRIRKSQVSAGTELNFYRHNPVDGPVASTRLGYMTVGVVEQVGDGVTAFAPGDRVLATGNHGSHWIVELNDEGAPINGANAIEKLDDAVSDDIAGFAVLGDVSLHGVRRAEPQIDESVVVFGCGIVGQLTIQLARIAGCHPIIAVDLAETRLQQARISGATHTINASTGDPVKQVMEITNGVGGEIVFHCAPVANLLQTIMESAAERGKVMMTASAPGSAEIGLQVELMRRELSIIGIYEIGIDQPHGYWRWSRSRNRRACLRLMASGELRIDHLISHIVPYTEAEAMYATMRNGTEDWLGVVFDWTGFDHQPKA